MLFNILKYYLLNFLEIRSIVKKMFTIKDKETEIVAIMLNVIEKAQRILIHIIKLHNRYR